MKKNGNVSSESKGFRALMYQLLETELGGVKIYQAALECVINEDLKEEWQKYLDETTRHVEIAQALLEELGIDPKAEVPARLPVRTVAKGLLSAIEVARKGGTPEEAQLVAAECVVQAETKDHLNWELVGLLAEKKLEPAMKKALKAAHEQVEEEEDHHLYHTTGWTRELWVEALGLPAALPPPEEVKQVKTAIGAARAKNAREDMV